MTEPIQRQARTKQTTRDGRRGQPVVAGLLALGALWMAAGAGADEVVSAPSALSAAAPVLAVSPFGGSGPGGTLSSFDAFSAVQTDVLFAASGTNAYALGWKNARWGSETVACAGRVLMRDVDYTLDYAAGMIGFSRSLPPGTMVRVTYTVDTLEATRSRPAAPQSLHWDLWQSGENRLRFRTLYRAERDPAAPVSPDAPQFGLNALQWNDSVRVARAGALQTQLDSGLFVDLQGGDWLNRGGLRVGERTRWNKSSFDLAYARAGALFTQSEDSGLPAGQQSLEAKIGATPLPGVTATGSVKQTAQVAASVPVAPAASGATNAPVPTDTSASLGLELVALRRTKIIAALNEHFDKDGLRRSREARVELPRLKAGQTQISVGVQTSDAPDGRRVTGLLTANSRPLRALDVTGDARLRDGQTTDDKPDPIALNTYALKMKYAPSPRLNLTGDMTLNPEQDGGAKRGQRRAVGLESDWGLFALRGQVGMDDDFALSRSTDASDLGLDLRLSRRDTLTTGFHAANLFDRATAGANTYSVGFKRRVGSTFDLMLNGSLTQPTNSADTTRPEIKTEAKLGLHF